MYLSHSVIYDTAEAVKKQQQIPHYIYVGNIQEVDKKTVHKKKKSPSLAPSGGRSINNTGRQQRTPLLVEDY